MLSNQEMTRYGRQLILPEIGIEGQIRLREASVLCVGVGGLGCPAATYLVAAGIGKVGLIDDDVVELSNLHRQVLHSTDDIGRAKVDSARNKLASLNPEVDITVHREKLSIDNVLDICGQYDVIADCSDNYKTRYLVNDACVILGRVLVQASVFRFEGQLSTYDAARGPCYRCLFPEPPMPGEVPNCAEGGVLGVLPGVLGVMQATEIVKTITGVGEPLIGKLVRYDALQTCLTEFQLNKDPTCPACGAESLLLQDLHGGNRDLEGPNDDIVVEITPAELKASLSTSDSRLIVLDVREDTERQLCRIEGSLHIPLGALPDRLNELNRDNDIVLYCLGGHRSKQGASILLSSGFPSVRSLAGGMTAWAAEVDQTMPLY